MPEPVPEAPVESRPPYVNEPAEVQRWNLAVAVAPRLLGDDASTGELWFLARHLYKSDMPTE